jgi:pimeloyl-ACP methyl ester carboxylesterase
VTPLEQGKAIAKSIPGSKLLIIPDVGHMPPIEAEQAFNDAVLDFLRSKAGTLQHE